MEAGTIWLKRITQRIKNLTAEKIGTLWNHIDAKETNEFGEYIGPAWLALFLIRLVRK